MTSPRRGASGRLRRRARPTPGRTSRCGTRRPTSRDRSGRAARRTGRWPGPPPRRLRHRPARQRSARRPRVRGAAGPGPPGARSLRAAGLRARRPRHAGMPRVPQPGPARSRTDHLLRVGRDSRSRGRISFRHADPPDVARPREGVCGRPRLPRVTALLALLSGLMWGTADFVGGLLSRRIRPVVVVAVSQGLAFLVLLLWVTVIGAWDDPHGYLPWAAAAGVVGPLSLTAFYGALSIGTMGVVAPIASAGVLLPVLLGLLSGDRPSLLQYVGIGLAIIGVILASGPELRPTRGDTGPGPTTAQARAVVLAVVAAVGFGFVLWFVAKAGRTSVPMTIVTQRGVSTLTMAIVLLLIAVRQSARPDHLRPAGLRDSHRSLRTRDLPVLGAVGLGDALANGAFAQASTGGLLSIVSVLGSLYPVATLVLARIFLKERLLPIQLKGVTVALFGIVLIGLGGGTG